MASSHKEEDQIFIQRESSLLKIEPTKNIEDRLVKIPAPLILSSN
jgi:hypothetical protein